MQFKNASSFSVAADDPTYLCIYFDPFPITMVRQHSNSLK